MRRFFVFAMLILGMVACDKDRTHEQINVGVGGEIEAKVCVEIPESVTRAGGGSDKGVFENGILNDTTTMRYILEIINKDAAHPTNRMVVFTNEMSADFDIRLAPDRNYIFVVWADVVTKEPTETEFSDRDNHYDTSDLHAVKVFEDKWNAMDESRDAFTGTKTIYNFNNASVIKLTLRRPNAKLRVLTKDMSSNVAPAKAKFTYNSPIYTTYNAVTGNVVKDDNALVIVPKVHKITYSNVYKESGNEYTLFSDYFFADDKVDETITFTLEVKDSNNTSIANISLNSGCKVKSTWLTTIAGNLLTSGSSSNQSAEF